MSEIRTRLIETAVRPFDDNAEMKVAASHFVGELAKADPEAAEEAIPRWDAVDGKRASRYGGGCFFRFCSSARRFFWRTASHAFAVLQKMRCDYSACDSFGPPPGDKSSKHYGC